MSKVTIISIYINHKHIEQMVVSLPKGDYELRVVDNTRQPHLSFAEANNLAAQDVETPHILFLNDDIKATNDFLSPMLKTIARPTVGIVGAKLLYPNGEIQHDGIEPIKDVTDFLQLGFRYFKKDSDKERKCLVTGACLLIKTDLFKELNGFDENFINGFEDIDLCIRAYNHGWDSIYTPEACLIHKEAASRGKPDKYYKQNINYLRSTLNV
ncbi:MAG: glycosyltransferase [Alphaproteobacteria bacterium]|nr:glycosyltransferase [Alphaproteobacteria bacterium]